MGSDIGLRQLFTIDFDKKLEQQRRAAGYANPEEKVDLFLKRRANLFNLGRSARVPHRRPLSVGLCVQALSLGRFLCSSCRLGRVYDSYAART